MIFRFCFALLVMLSLSACAGPVLRGNVVRPGPIDVAAPFVAGAARVDITPPPGIPMGGHALSGKVSRGVWTRLYARAIFMEGSGSRLVLVSTDLWAFPAGLGDRVVEVLAERGGPTIGREQVVFAATHTHQSPGGFATSNHYNQMASRHAGFDERLFEFLADRIAKAIHDAREASVAATLSVGRTTVAGLQVNRSLEAFLMNPEARSLIGAPAVPTPEIGFPVHPDAFKAVDPGLVVFRLASITDETLALAAFFAVHNTTMSHATELYTGDFFGVAATSAERALAGSGQREPVVALFNGAEGDVSPTWRRQDSRDAVRLGEMLADAIVSLSGMTQSVDTAGGFRFAYRIVDIADACSPRAAGICTAAHAMAGVAAGGGAEDGRSGFWELGWREGVTGPPRDDGHGRKQPVIDPPFVPLHLPFGLTPTQLFLPMGDGDVPRSAPIGVYSIDDVALVTLPGEFTTTLGGRIARGVANAVGSDPERTVLVGLANEYLAYFTTPEEYDAQHYEGASTIYGRWAGRVVLDVIVQLAGDLRGYVDERPAGFKYHPGDREEFGVRSLGDRPVATPNHFEAIAVDPSDGELMQGLPTACWIDGIATLPGSYPSSGFADEISVTPRVRIQRAGGGGWNDVEGADDKGFQIMVYGVEVEATNSTGCGTWMPPEEVQPIAADEYRIMVRRTSMEPLACAVVTGDRVRFAHLSPCS